MSGVVSLQEDCSSQQASIILVSGAPASGKTTLARSLSQTLRFAHISKDPLKEALFDSLRATLHKQQQTPEELSRLLSQTAMELLWSIAPTCPRVILEANFRPKSDYERQRIGVLQGRKLEVFCHCTPAERQDASQHARCGRSIIRLTA